MISPTNCICHFHLWSGNWETSNNPPNYFTKKLVVSFNISIITNIIIKLSNQIITFLSTRDHLCSKISRIFSSRNVFSQAFALTHCNSLSLWCTLANLAGLLLCHRLRLLSDVDQRHILVSMNQR